MDAKRCAAGRIVFDQQPAAVSLDDGAADREPHAQTVRLRGEERLEDAVDVVRGDALARVVHGQLDVRRRRDHRPHGDPSGRPTGGRGDGVGEQVQDHLLDLHVIAKGDRQRRRREELDGDAVEQGVVRDEADRVRDQVIERYRQPHEVGLLEQPPRTADHLGRPPVVADDVLETGPELAQVRLQPGQQPAPCLGVGEDRRQRLGQLVRERRRQLAHARNPVEMGELCHVALGGRLGLPARRHVEQHDRRSPAPPQQASHPELEPAVLATARRRIFEDELVVLAGQDGLHGRVRLAGEVARHVEGVPAGVQIVAAHRQRLLHAGFVPRGGGPRLVGLQDRAIGVDDGRLARQRRQHRAGEGRAALEGGSALRTDQGMGEVLGQRSQLPHEIVGPCALRAQADEREEAEPAIIGVERDRGEGANPERLEGRALRRRLRRKVVGTLARHPALARLHAAAEVQERSQIDGRRRRDDSVQSPEVRDRDGEIGRWLRQRPAIHAEERHDPAQTVADPIVDMLCRRGGAHGRDLALQRPEAQTLGQSGLGVIREILGPHGADDELLVRVSKAIEPRLRIGHRHSPARGGGGRRDSPTGSAVSSP